MNRLTGKTLKAVLAVAFLLSGGVVPAAAQDAGAVGERITIMVPDLAPRNGANDKFGERVADDLRDMISNLHTHQTVSGRDIKRARREFDLAHEDLYDCIRARQLAMRQNWGLVLCAEYEETGGNEVAVDAKFVGSQDGYEFAVDPFSINERETEQAAQQIFQAFDRFQTQLRHTVFCQQYMDSENWGRALENCNQALDINPTYVSALYKKAFILRQMERQEEALETLDELLEQDPIHQDALKLAGIAATEADMPERARAYFDRYMELNPGDVGVRLTIATEIANAGDPAAAMAFAEEGVELEPENLTLHTYIGHFAAQAAGKAEAAMAQEGVEAQGAIDPTKVQEYYQTAADAYRRVYEEQADSTEAQILERMTIALFKLGQYEEAIELGEEAVELDPENPALWDAYSRALQEAGRLDEALAAIERVEELGRTSAGITSRKAQLQLTQGDESAAVAALTEGVEQGHLEASQAFNIVFASAYRDKFQQGQLNAAYQLLDAAGPLAQTEKDRLTRNFWRGYIVFEQAKAVHEPMTAASAQEAKPMFERALELFQAASGYERYHESADVPRLIDAAKRYIEIEEALIKRGR